MDKDNLEQMVEPVARWIAAEKMDLIKDEYGENLPDELWRGSIKQARSFLGLE